VLHTHTSISWLTLLPDSSCIASVHALLSGEPSVHLWVSRTCRCAGVQLYVLLLIDRSESHSRLCVSQMQGKGLCRAHPGALWPRSCTQSSALGSVYHNRHSCAVWLDVVQEMHHCHCDCCFDPSAALCSCFFQLALCPFFSCLCHALYASQARTL
jgi:hypothetical protein